MHVYGIISIHGNEWADERTLKQAQQNFFAELAFASSFLFSVITAKMKKVRFNGLKILKKYQKSL